ncbi:MAG: MFS transporter, partial [Verrucomicrobiota bacterium]
VVYLCRSEGHSREGTDSCRVYTTVGIVFSIPGQTMGFSVFTDVLMEQLQLSRVGLSTAYCIGTVASGLTLPWLGRVLDRWGERKMVVASSLVTGLVLLYLSVAANLTHRIAGWLPPESRTAVAFVVIGLGFYFIRMAAQGVLTMTCRNAIGKWFNHQRGLALAISGVVVSFGFSSAPSFLDMLVERFTYQGAWVVMGMATIGIMAPLGWLLFRDTPEESGLEMDGGPPNTRRPENPDMQIHREYTRAEALRTYSFWVFNLSFAYVGLFMTAFTFHIVSLGEAFGFTRTFILSLFIPMAVVSVSTNLTFGWVNTRVRLKKLLFLVNLGSMIGSLGLLFLDSSWGVVAYVAGNGVAGGGFVNLMGNVYPRFFGRKWLGGIAGVGMSTTVIASGLGPLLFGASAEWAGGYQLALIICIIVPGLLTLSSLFANNPQLRNR